MRRSWSIVRDVGRTGRGSEYGTEECEAGRKHTTRRCGAMQGKAA